MSLLTMREAAGTLFPWSYRTLRAKVKALEAEGCPVDRSTGRPMFNPTHVELWRISRYSEDARRALRQEGVCTNAAGSGISASTALDNLLAQGTGREPKHLKESSKTKRGTRGTVSTSRLGTKPASTGLKSTVT